MSAPRVSVIIPARDAQATLPRTLAALGEQDVGGISFDVTVVDNGSLDATASVAERSGVVTRVVRRARGEGPGPARNAGVEAAAGSVLAFLDADCRPAPGWLAAGFSACADADLVQGRVLPDPEADLGPFDRTLSVGDAHGLFESANLFVARETFERAGGFPAGLEGSGEAPFGEDVIFGWRAVRAGARTAFCSEALVYHEVRARGAGGFLAERARLALFPGLAAAVPELRCSFLYRRFFLSPRTARFDVAAAGVLVALVTRRRAALAAAVPYVYLLAADARHWGARRAPLAAAVGVAADARGATALFRASLRSRSFVL